MLVLVTMAVTVLATVVMVMAMAVVVARLTSEPCCKQNGEYLTKLLKVFSDCEDMDDEESLRLLCNIFKAIVGLNDATLLEVSGRVSTFVGAYEA